LEREVAQTCFKSFVALNKYHLNIFKQLLGQLRLLVLYTYIYFAGLEQFAGRMQDFRLYKVALTNR
jgi:hypothetical protein